MELAPNVVDASAVALPNSPHVITDVEFDCDASVPVFDPLESDEEEELDAPSRNVTSVPAVGRADVQGPTQVDYHDELFVGGRFRGCTRTVPSQAVPWATVLKTLHQRNTILSMCPMCRVRQRRTDFSASQQNLRMNRHQPTRDLQIPKASPSA